VSLPELLRRRRAKRILKIFRETAELSFPASVEIYRRLLALQESDCVRLFEHSKTLVGMLMRSGGLAVVTNSTKRMRRELGLPSLKFNQREVEKITAATELLKILGREK
jgi:hypothetical protein